MKIEEDNKNYVMVLIQSRKTDFDPRITDIKNTIPNTSV